MRRELSVFALLFVLLSVSLASAQYYDTGDVLNGLRKALYVYYTSPSESSLTKEDLQKLIAFYVNIKPGEITVNCTQHLDKIDIATKLQDRIPGCSDGTKYGKCSSAKPMYCYAGSLVPRCRLCGCPEGEWCDVTYVYTEKGNMGQWGKCYPGTDVICAVDSDCGASAYVGGHYCKGGDVHRNYTKYTCLDPGEINSSCTTEMSAVLIDDCNATEKCVEGQSECQTNILSEVRVNGDYLNEYYFLLEEYYFKFLNPEFGRGCADNYCQNVTHTDTLVLEGNMTVHDRYYEDIIDDIRSRDTNGTYYINVICFGALEIGGDLYIEDTLEVGGCLVTIDYRGVIPDLKVTDIILNPQQPMSGKGVNVTIVVQNVGNADAYAKELGYQIVMAHKTTHKSLNIGAYLRDFSVDTGETYYIDKTVQLSDLPVGEYYISAAVDTMDPSGMHHQMAWINLDDRRFSDADLTIGAIIELNEFYNNRLMETFVIGEVEALPDLIITGMTWPSYIEPGKTFLGTMPIKNIGNAPFPKPDVSITWAIATPLTTPRCVHGGFSSSLLPSESVNQSFVISCVELEQYNKPNLNNMGLPEGTFEITVIIDYDNAVKELNETNNNFTKTIVVGKPTTPTCIDDDTGKDYFVKGTIKSWNGTVESYDCCAKTATDSTCMASSNYLVERYCTTSGFMTEIYTCPSGCINGACIRTVNKPDLIITGMTWPSYIEPNKSIYPVNMTIKNIGNASKPYSSIIFAIVNPLTTPRCVHGGFWASILPGESVYKAGGASCVELDKYNGGFPAGTYEMTTVIDYDNGINEWNETNNNFTKTVVVGGPIG